MADAKRERAEQILGELSELGLMLARDLAVAARAAVEPEEKVTLAAANPYGSPGSPCRRPEDDGWENTRRRAGRPTHPQGADGFTASADRR